MRSPVLAHSPSGSRREPSATRGGVLLATAVVLLLLVPAGFSNGAGPGPALASAATLSDTTAAAVPVAPVPAPAPGWRATRVSYLSGGSVYLEAGRDEGLAEGDTAWIVRDGRRVAALRVAFISTHRASCDTLWTKGPLAIGDAASFRAAAGRAPGSGGGTSEARADSLRRAAVLAPPGERAARREASLRGRLGARWLGVESDGAGRTSQPAVEARLETRDGLGGHLDLMMDMRGRRTLRTHDGGRWVDQYSRVYRASATVRDEGGLRRLTLGRQTSPTLASVSLFDGALAEWNGKRNGFGAFAGTQPEPLRFGWSDEIAEAGVFAEMHQAPLARDRWSLSAGAVSSWHGSQVDRDFVFLQGWWFSRAASASLAQEVDVNRGWKRSAGESALAWTSTFATLRVPVGKRVALHSGFDNRRNVRLWRDRETPETDFDDHYRQGAWVGGQVNWTDFLSSAAEYRTGSGGDRSDAWSVSGELHRATRWHALLRGRVSSYASRLTESGLWSLAAGFDPESRSHLEVSFGSRWTRDPLSGFEDTERWAGADLDLALGQRWYATGGFERLTGPSGSTRQVQAGLSVRF